MNSKNTSPFNALEKINAAATLVSFFFLPFFVRKFAMADAYFECSTKVCCCQTMDFWSTNGAIVELFTRMVSFLAARLRKRGDEPERIKGSGLE